MKTAGVGIYIGTKSNYKKGIDGVILKFTFDDKIIFGISIEENSLTDEGQLIDNYDKAFEIQIEIQELTNSTKTCILLEYAPAVVS